MTFGPCPRCGDDIGTVVSTEPGIETMRPCGCRVAIDGGEEIGQSLDDTARSTLSLNPVVPAEVCDLYSGDACSSRPQDACRCIVQFPQRNRSPDTPLGSPLFLRLSCLNLRVLALFTTIGRQLTGISYNAQKQNCRSIATDIDRSGPSSEGSW